MKQAMQLLTGQATVEWYTPPFIIERARATLGGVIDLDPASCATAQAWIQAETFYTAEDAISGLARPWFGHVWLNPPFDDTARWAARLDRESAHDVAAAVLLVNSAPGYIWWEQLWRERPVVLLRERLRFVREDGALGGQAKKGQTLAYFGPRPHFFFDTFGDLGRCLMPEGQHGRRAA